MEGRQRQHLALLSEAISIATLSIKPLVVLVQPQKNQPMSNTKRHQGPKQPQTISMAPQMATTMQINVKARASKMETR